MEAAHQSISRWFEDNPAVAPAAFLDYLTTRVRVLRYDAGDENPVELFTRLNVGRIPLTDAELVKALLLSRSRGDCQEVDRSQEIAAQ